MSKKEAVTSAMLKSMIANSLLAAVKFVAGIAGNSFALIADAIESTADIFSSLLVLVGVRYSIKPPDENHPYGHGRAESLVTFAIVAFLTITATSIAYQGITNLFEPQLTPKAFTIPVLIGIVALKEILYRFLKKKGTKLNSSSIEAEAWHQRADAITSMLALLGVSIAVIGGKGYEIADDIAAIFASLLIFINAYRIFRPALGEFMDEHLHQELEAEIRKLALEVPGVMDTEKCHIRKIGLYYIIDLHMIVDGDIPVKDGHQISHDLKNFLMNEMSDVRNVNIHVEPFNLEKANQR